MRRIKEDYRIIIFTEKKIIKEIQGVGEPCL